jgi:DNA-binding NarL/FixJ family response regulator
MITLLLVDDEPLVRHGLRMWLERVADIMVIGEASDGAEAIALAQVLHPDVVLMNISMPTIDGIAATEALRALVPHCAVVLLSLYDDVTMQARAHVAGAATLVGKQEGVKAFWLRYAKPEGRDVNLFRGKMPEISRVIPACEEVKQLEQR